jgi:hypothetical protein
VAVAGRDEADREIPGGPVREHPKQRLWEWQAQRFGWLLMGLIVVYGLLGGWGNGLLSGATVEGSGGLEVSYDRFVRDGGESSLQLQVPAQPGGDTAQVRVSQEFLSANQVESVTPQPDSVTAVEADLLYEFPTEEHAEVEVTFNLRPEGPGTRTGSVGLPDSEPVVFGQFVYP